MFKERLRNKEILSKEELEGRLIRGEYTDRSVDRKVL